MCNGTLCKWQKMTLRVFDLFVQVVDKSDTCRLFELYWTQAYSWVRLYNTLFRFVTWQRTLETYYFKGRADMFKADVNFRRWRSYSHLGRVIAAQTAKYVTLTWRVVRATTFVRRVISTNDRSRWFRVSRASRPQVDESRTAAEARGEIADGTSRRI